MLKSAILKLFLAALLLSCFNATAQSALTVKGGSSAGLYIGKNVAVQAMGNVEIAATGTMSFEATGTPDFRLKGNVANSGTFNCGTSTITFNGSTNQTSSALTYHNLTLNNTTAPATSAATLGGNIVIGGTITLTTGVLNTGAFLVDLGASGAISEAAIAPTSYVSGSVKATRNTGSTSGAVTFGGIGLQMTETTRTNNSTEVIRRTGTASVGYGNNSILRNFDINPAVDVALNGSIVLSYTNAELSGQAEDSLKIYKSDAPYTTWSQQNTTVNAAANTLTVSGITSFSRWTGSNKVSNALPIELLSLNAALKENVVAVTWQTTTEKNNDYFILEKSYDRKNWQKTTQVKAVGNSNTVSNYIWNDQANFNGMCYYKLTQVDVDGQNETFNIVSVKNSNTKKINEIILYPNPSSDHFSLEYFSDNEDEFNILIESDNGQEVYHQNHVISKGENIIHISSASFSSGLYIVVIENNFGEKVTKKIIKN
jgi:hypothetical protein